MKEIRRMFQDEETGSIIFEDVEGQWWRHTPMVVQKIKNPFEGIRYE